jgi:ethanolamine utilization protein EutN
VSAGPGCPVLIGRVLGRVVATIRTPGLDGVRFLLVQPLDDERKPKGTPIVAADALHTAGPGDLVHYEGGREAALALDPWFVPIDHAITGLVDRLTVGVESREDR